MLECREQSVLPMKLISFVHVFIGRSRSRVPRRPCLMSLAAIKDEMCEEQRVAQESSSRMIHGPNQPRRYATRENISSRSLLSKLITKSHKFSLPLLSRRQFFKKCSIVRRCLVLSSNKHFVLGTNFLFWCLSLSYTTVRFLVLTMPMLRINGDHKSWLRLCTDGQL